VIAMSLTPSNEVVVPSIKVESLIEQLKKGLRLDGRKLTDFRPIEIKVGYVDNADGSAFVKLGDTQVLVGIKLEVGRPYPDTPNEGVLTVHAEFVPTASPTFEPGPPDENAIELSRVVDRGIREAKVIDLGKLAIIPGEKVWIVWVDIYVLDHDGNLIDASALGAMAALLSTKMPKYEITEDGNVKVIKEERGDYLPLNRGVITVTAAKIGDHIIIDPTLEEESLCEARITFSVTNDGLIAGMQKAGMGYLTNEEVQKIVDIALAKGKEIFGIIEKAVGRAITPKKGDVNVTKAGSEGEGGE